jgi:hypothetical protein
MVQDPLPASSFDPQTSFAQPIVFFSLEVFRPFSLSALARSITHLRICVPSRPVLAQLLARDAFPSLKVLDISTSTLGDPERSLPLLLARHQNLEHLLLDSCPLSRERWRDLARACALAGQGKSRAREKKINAWLERSSLRRADTVGHGVTTIEADRPVPSNLTQARAARRGRRGVATAAFSIRTTPDSRLTSSEASSNRYAPNGNDANMNSRRTKVRILPPLPSLRTLSTTFAPPPDAEKANDWRAEFEAGWQSGIETLMTARIRLHTSALAGVAGVRIMRFDNTFKPPETSYGGDIEESFYNLVDVGLDETDIWEAECGVPVVCFGNVGQVSKINRLRGSENEDQLDVRHQFSPADSGIGQGLPSATSSHVHSEENAPLIGEGHATGCGHELQKRIWDIYERVVETL